MPRHMRTDVQLSETKFSGGFNRRARGVVFPGATIRRSDHVKAVAVASTFAFVRRIALRQRAFGRRLRTTALGTRANGQERGRAGAARLDRMIRRFLIQSANSRPEQHSRSLIILMVGNWADSGPISAVRRHANRSANIRIGR